MKKFTLKSCVSAASIAVMSLSAMPALAQDAPADDAAAPLDEIVVTASGKDKTQLNSSVSVTSVSAELIDAMKPSSESEVFRMIPGIQVPGTSGPGGNSNIAVRGLPVATGGSPFVQIQEDGLPTVLFGDIQFGNNDYWIRFDNNVDSIQTLRGGSASTFASHAPGAVINYISKTGREEGGSIGLSKGLNYKENRVDGDFGGKLGNGLRFHVGGYYREGEGNRHYGDNALLGYQLKGNITKEFNGGKGYVRLNFKLLDEHAPTTPQTFVNAKLSGTSVGSFSNVAGYDGARDSQYSSYNASYTGLNPATRQVTSSSLLDGITVKSKSVGMEFHNELSGGFTVDNKFRVSKNSGAFQTQFWDVQTFGNLMGGYAAGSTARYYNGPGAGSVVSAGNLATGLVSKGAAINTQLGDMGNIVNDLSRVEGVGTVQVFGAQYSMRIWLDPSKLAAYELTPGDVVRAVSAENAQISAGSFGDRPAPEGQMLNATVTGKRAARRTDSRTNRKGLLRNSTKKKQIQDGSAALFRFCK